MFPIFAGRKSGKKQNHSQALQQLCPLGCLCCILEQFYQKKCWCRAMKETVGTQTDGLPYTPHTQGHENELLNMACQTDCTFGIKIEHDESIGDEHSKLSYNKETRQGEENTSAEVTKASKKMSETAHTKRQHRHRRHPYMAGLDLRQVKPHSKAEQLDSSNRSVSSKMQVINPGLTNTETSKASIILKANKNALFERYFSHGMMEYSQMQNTMGQLVEQYDLAGARDVNFELALCDVFRRFPELADDPNTRKIVRDKLRHKISSRRHYHKMKSEATLSGVGVSVLKRHRRHENDIITSLIGETTIQNSLQSKSSFSDGLDEAVDLKVRLEVTRSEDTESEVNGLESTHETSGSGGGKTSPGHICGEDLSLLRWHVSPKGKLPAHNGYRLDEIVKKIKQEPIQLH